MRFASSQQDGEKAPFSICECVYLLLRPPRERPTACFCSPLFRPLPSDALSRAWSSIICVSVDRPFPAKSRKKKTPRRAQRTKRL